jgi:integrase/recombinase XerD
MRDLCVTRIVNSMFTTEIAVRGTDLASLTAAWLWSYRDSAHTRAAYQRDVTDFAGWCAGLGLDVSTLRRAQVDAYAAMLTNTASPVTGRPLSPASVARKLAAISSWYAYLVDAGTVAQNPCERVRRPKVDKDTTTTVGLTANEALRLRQAALGDAILPADTVAALAGFLVEIGARVSEVCALDIEDLGSDSGHRTVRLRMKGGKSRVRAVPPRLSMALTIACGGRATGPVFTSCTGQRLTRHDVYRFVRRAAVAAELEAADRITPHSLRHAWATIARERGASLEERQYALGHADPRTTQRYDRARASLDRDPSYLVSAATYA